MTKCPRDIKSKSAVLDVGVNNRIVYAVEKGCAEMCIYPQSEFLQRVPISQSAWSRFSRGSQDLKFQQILRICEVLKIDTPELMSELEIYRGL